MLDLRLITDTDEEDDDDIPPPPHTQLGKQSSQQHMAAHRIVKDIGWHHLYVYWYNKSAQYEDLYIAGFAYGSADMCLMENCTPADAPQMSVFFKDIMEDASDYKWEHVRGCHAIVLNIMETCRLS